MLLKQQTETHALDVSVCVFCSIFWLNRVVVAKTSAHTTGYEHKTNNNKRNRDESIHFSDNKLRFGSLWDSLRLVNLLHPISNILFFSTTKYLKRIQRVFVNTYS